MLRDRMVDEKYMKVALEEAKKAGQRGEVPVGAILLKGDQVLAKDHNRCIELSDPTAHAEILVLRKGGE
ncbi:MAG: deaminase, partial [Thermodesulfobacteriota bacterium]